VGGAKELQDLADYRRGVAGEHPVAPAGERHQPRPGDPGRQVAAQPVGNGPVVAPVQHQRWRGDTVEGFVDPELIALGQQLGGDLGGRGPTLQLGEAHLGLRGAVGKMSASTSEPSPQCARTSSIMAARTSAEATW
jgi:hypothetical protein